MVDPVSVVAAGAGRLAGVIEVEEPRFAGLAIRGGVVTGCTGSVAGHALSQERISVGPRRTVFLAGRGAVQEVPRLAGRTFVKPLACADGAILMARFANSSG